MKKGYVEDSAISYGIEKRAQKSNFALNQTMMTNNPTMIDYEDYELC